MKVDGNIGMDLRSVAQNAQEVEAAGYSGAWTAETSHDPFLPLLLAAEHTERLEIGTSIAVAFARSPMTLANTAWDLQAYSQGRFILGLGSQIKPHITKRFSMDWSHPAARMREFVLAMRAIWNTWLTGEKLDFRGEFYTHTLMTPFFTPPASDLEGFGPPKVFLAGVGELMTEVAGEVCDGFLCHGFTTEKYLREVTIPALERGRAKAGKTMEGFEIMGPSFVVTGNNDEELEAAATGTRQQIAFYGSTPAYRNVCLLYTSPSPRDHLAQLVCRLLLEKKIFLMIRRPPRSTLLDIRRQRQMCIRDSFRGGQQPIPRESHLYLRNTLQGRRPVSYTHLRAHETT